MILPMIIIGALIMCVMLLAKNENTYTNHNRVLFAIYRYSLINNLTSLEFSEILREMEPYNHTMFRLWDWSCKRIVRPEVYEKIKEYIK